MIKTKFILLAALGLLGIVASAHAQNTAFIGLNTGGVSIAGYSAPGAAPVQYTIGGLGTDQLVSIDYLNTSVGNRQLYGMAASGNLYSLSQTSTTGYTGTLSNSLGVGGVSTIDFNPTVNRLRVFAGTANYRITPGGGTAGVTSDGTLAYNTGDVAFGSAPALFAAAYTNSVFGAATTTLFSLDTTRDTLVTHINGPQFNTLNTVATLTLGGVTFNITPGNTGFDITTVNGINTAYVSSGNNLYTLNTTNGQLTLVGAQTSATGIIDIAFSIPEPGTYAMIAVGGLLLGVVAVRRRQQTA